MLTIDTYEGEARVLFVSLTYDVFLNHWIFNLLIDDLGAKCNTITIKDLNAHNRPPVVAFGDEVWGTFCKIPLWFMYNYMYHCIFVDHIIPSNEIPIYIYIYTHKTWTWSSLALHINGLGHNCSNFSVLAIELLLSCTKPSISLNI